MTGSGRVRVALVPVLATAWIGTAVTASSVVPTTRIGGDEIATSANRLKPAACAAISLNGIRTGSGTFHDVGQPHLVLGSAGADVIRGLPGNDCIVGGAGADSLRGDQGIDVCIGGAGVDTFHASCETQIQ
jgi:Ca2+-binding RTX toxin-like protein